MCSVGEWGWEGGGGCHCLHQDLGGCVLCECPACPRVTSLNFQMREKPGFFSMMRGDRVRGGSPHYLLLIYASAHARSSWLPVSRANSTQSQSVRPDDGEGRAEERAHVAVVLTPVLPGLKSKRFIVFFFPSIFFSSSSFLSSSFLSGPRWL